MLCEFKREEDSKSVQSKKKDYVFFFKHCGSWQNLYRLEFKLATNASLYICLSIKNLKVCKNKLTLDVGGWSILWKNKKQDQPNMTMTYYFGKTQVPIMMGKVWSWILQKSISQNLYQPVSN